MDHLIFIASPPYNPPSSSHAICALQVQIHSAYLLRPPRLALSLMYRCAAELDAPRLPCKLLPTMTWRSMRLPATAGVQCIRLLSGVRASMHTYLHLFAMCPRFCAQCSPLYPSYRPQTLLRSYLGHSIVSPSARSVDIRSIQLGRASLVHSGPCVCFWTLNLFMVNRIVL